MFVDDEYSCSDDAFDGDEHDEELDVVPEEFRQQVILYRNFDPLHARSGLTKQKSRRRRWTQRDMTNAYNAVKYQGMSLRGAATAFNVPESTLRDRVHGRVSLECSRPGPPTFFTFEEEKKMVDHILFMSKIGYPYTRNQVVELAGDMTKAVGRIAPFKYLNPSQAWFYAFLNRWPDLKNFLFGPRSNRKSKGVSGDAIQAYFEQLDTVLTKYGIKDKPEHMWIVDEVSISCENQPPRILPIGIQRAQSVSYWNPTVAMIGAAGAAGEKIPPFLIYRGDSITTNMMEGAVRGTKFANSPSGWVNSDAFIQWFLKHFRQNVVKRPLILLYDGHLQFVSVRVLERAREDGVLLFPLPPHPAYNHCVENTCFFAFQHFFQRRQERFFAKNPKQLLVKLNVAPVLSHAYERALQPASMVALFEKLGICPFNNLSTSIGAYLNIPDDFESMNPDLEDGMHERIAGMTPQWAPPNLSSTIAASSNSSIFTSIQNFCSSSQPSSTQSEALFSSANISAERSHRSTPPVLLTSSNSLLRDENQRIVVKKIAPSSPQSTPLVRSVAAKISQIDSQLTQQFSIPSKISSNGRNLSIRLQGPGANRIRPLLSTSEVNLETISLSNVQTVMSTVSPAHNTTQTTVSRNSGDELKLATNLNTRFSNRLSQDESQILLNCYTSEAGFSPVVSQISDSHIIRQINHGETEHVEGLMDAGAVVEVVDDIEEGEAPGVCAVCGLLEPPGFGAQSQSLGDMDECQVVDWAHCDYCYRWVHLNKQCSRDAVIVENSFMCALCHYTSDEPSEEVDNTAKEENVISNSALFVPASSTT